MATNSTFYVMEKAILVSLDKFLHMVKALYP